MSPRKRTSRAPAGAAVPARRRRDDGLTPAAGPRDHRAIARSRAEVSAAAAMGRSAPGPIPGKLHRSRWSWRRASWGSGCALLRRRRTHRRSTRTRVPAHVPAMPGAARTGDRPATAEHGPRRAAAQRWTGRLWGPASVPPATVAHGPDSADRPARWSLRSAVMSGPPVTAVRGPVQTGRGAVDRSARRAAHRDRSARSGADRPWRSGDRDSAPQAGGGRRGDGAGPRAAERGAEWATRGAVRLRSAHAQVRDRVRRAVERRGPATAGHPEAASGTARIAGARRPAPASPGMRGSGTVPGGATSAPAATAMRGRDTAGRRAVERRAARGAATSARAQLSWTGYGADDRAQWTGRLGAPRRPADRRPWTRSGADRTWRSGGPGGSGSRDDRPAGDRGTRSGSGLTGRGAATTGRPVTAVRDPVGPALAQRRPRQRSRGRGQIWRACQRRGRAAPRRPRCAPGRRAARCRQAVRRPPLGSPRRRAPDRRAGRRRPWRSVRVVLARRRGAAVRAVR